MTDGVTRRRRILGCAGATALGAALQVRFVAEPLTADEAGGQVVARAWAATGRPWETAWMDRPQGLLIVHRAWDAISTDPRFLRLLAVLAVAACALAAGAIAARLFGASSRVTAVVLCSVAMASPALEGFAANAGLISLAVSLPSLALAVAVLFGRVPSPLLGLAGAGCMAAITVKQSAVDAPVALVAWLVVAAIAGWMTPRAAAVRAAWLATGAGVVGAAAVGHGIASVGWSEYWHVIAGYHLAERSGVSNPRIEGLLANTMVAAPVLGVMVVGVALAARARGRLRTGPAGAFAVIWLVAASVAMLSGGNFHRHYFLVVAAPVAVMAAWAFAEGRSGVPSLFGVRTATAACLLFAVPFAVRPSLAVGGAARHNAAVAEWVRETENREGRALSVYALCSSAGLYSELDRLPGYPYLWRDNVELMDRARAELADYLAGPRAPEIVAVYQRCDTDPEAQRALAEDYREVARVGPVVLLRSR